MKWLTVALVVIAIALVGCTAQQQAPVPAAPAVPAVQTPAVPTEPAMEAPTEVGTNPEAQDAEVYGQTYGADCVDTDSIKATDQGSSLNTAVKGTATDATQSLTDACSSDHSVVEAYCQGGVVRARDINCKTGTVCVDASCVLESEADIMISQAAAETGADTGMTA